MPTLARPQTDSPPEMRRSVALAFDMLERYEPWHEIGSAAPNPAFATSWSNVGGGEDTVAFRKAVDGQVWLKGYIAATAGPGQGNTTTAFTLPDGYRPLTQQRLPCVGQAGGVFYTGHIVVKTNGAVSVSLRGLAANAAITDATMAGAFRTF